MTIFRFMVICAAVAITTVGALAFFLQSKATAVLPISKEKIVYFAPGSGLSSIAAKLQDEGIAPYPYIFKALALGMGKSATLKAGEYKFTPGETLIQAIEKISNGDVYFRKITFPEGSTTHEITSKLIAEPTFSGEVSRNYPEGSLLPETYFYTYGEPRQKVLNRLHMDMQRLVDELWQKHELASGGGRNADFPLKSKDEAVILASIVEAETPLAKERPIVAGVYLNRLKIGMKLQADPTVIYGITQGQGDMGRELSRKDLQTPTAYNTYTIEGLPPSAICNPGKSSLQAVFNPAETPYLYFVADGKGGHNFSKTLAEHNRHVSNYRAFERNIREKEKNND
jgi:UPF0755 protein